jgi:hypothetical protein
MEAAREFKDQCLPIRKYGFPFSWKHDIWMYLEHIYDIYLKSFHDHQYYIDQYENILSSKKIITSFLCGFSSLVLINDIYQMQPPVPFYFLTQIEISYRKVPKHIIPLGMEWNIIV